MELIREFFDLSLLSGDLGVRLFGKCSCLFMAIDASFELLVDFLLLLELLLGDGGQVDHFANLDLISHELTIALSEHAHCIEKLIVDSHFVFESTTVAVVKDINLLGLVLEVDLEVHCFVHSLIDALLLL